GAPAGQRRKARNDEQVACELHVGLEPERAPQARAEPEQRREHADREQRPPQHPPRPLGRIGAQQHADRQGQGRDQEPRPDQGAQPFPARQGTPPRLSAARREWQDAGGCRHLPPATTVMSLNIGRYMAITMPPTIPPMITIIMGSMIEVSVSTAVSTSAS